MDFQQFKRLLQGKLDFLIANSPALFQVNIEGDVLWETYLESYPAEANPIYRERRTHDCSCCKQFIRNYGKIVGVIDGQMQSIFDIPEAEDEYSVVCLAMSDLIHQYEISDAFYTKFKHLGTDTNLELTDDDRIINWSHLYYEMPDNLVQNTSRSIENLQGQIRSTKDVIARSFEELTPSAITTVLELIEQKNLYRGEEHKKKLASFATLQRGWITADNKNNYCWGVAIKHGRVAAIRNTAIGTLLIDLSAGMEIERAVTRYEKVVAPSNYKRPQAIVTQSQIDAAEKQVKELGLVASLGRKHASIVMLHMNDVIWASGESQKVMTSPFDILHNEVKQKVKKFDHIEEMGIQYFLDEVLPQAQSLEVLFDNKFESNLVNLIAPVNADALSLFQWENGFSWSYNGELTDSNIKEAVKTRGGGVDGQLRCSLMWAEGDRNDNSDLDIHCISPKSHIYYGSKKGTCGGMLDVDIRAPHRMGNLNIVENITWAKNINLPVGKYKFYVRNFAKVGIQSGFNAEIEYNGVIHSFHYPKGLRTGEDVDVATVEWDGKDFTIVTHIDSEQESKEIWGIKTQTFVPVTALMYSPNYWEGEKGRGNKHYFFMLEGCSNPMSSRGFYNEFLRPEFSEHKRVFELLGNKMRVEPEGEQLAGVGFSSTMKNSLVLNINSKPIKINFTDEQLIVNRSKKEVSV